MALTPPNVTFYAFNTDEVSSPSGLRHIPSGTFAFNKILGSGFSDALPFDGIRINSASLAEYYPSRVQAVIFRSSDISVNVSNMRFFMSRNDMSTSGIVRFQYAISGIWQPNPIWPSGIHDEPSSSVPLSQNLFRQDGSVALLSNNDDNVSQFIYLNAVVGSGHPFGIHGGGINGINLQFRVIYDYAEPT